jgi:hypothetical protein
MKTLSELLTELSTATANIENAKTVEELPNLNWHMARARSAIHNHVARARSEADRLGFADGIETGEKRAAAKYESAIIANTPAQPTAASFRAARNAIHDARILSESNGPTFGEMKQRPY